MTHASDTLPDDIDALRAFILAERAAYATIVGERDKLAVRNDRLLAIIKEIRRAHFGRKSERITDDQLALALEELETSLAKAEAEEEKADPALKTERTRKRRASRSESLDHLPHEEVVVEPEELGFAISIGELEVTECEMVNQIAGSKTEPPQFTRGYGLAFGHNERKAMAMSLVDRALRAAELGEAVAAPAQMQEFVLSHGDSFEASGFVQHLKLPHYVDFQSELKLVRQMRAQAGTDTLGGAA